MVTLPAILWSSINPNLVLSFKYVAFFVPKRLLYSAPLRDPLMVLIFYDYSHGFLKTLIKIT